MNKRTAIVLATLILAVLGVAGTAQAAEYDFQVLNDYYNDYDAASAALATTAADGTVLFLGMEVSGSGNSVTFTFTNNVPVTNPASITAIYWDFGGNSGAFSATPSMNQSTGVSFAQITGKKLNLPEGGTIGFDAMFGIANDGDVTAGINGGEWLSITWTLAGLTYDDVVSLINSGDIRIGMHVQSLPDAPNYSSMSVVNKTPLPGAVWLLGSGLLGLVGLRRKF